MGISWQELIVILLIVLVLFGPKRLPEIGSSLGRSIRGFKDSLSGREQLEASVAAAKPQVEEAKPAAGAAPSAASAQPAERVQPAAVEVVQPEQD